MFKFLLLLSCLDALDSYEITTVSRWKVRLSTTIVPTSDSRCFISSDISNVDAPNKMRACQIFCMDAGEANCNAFIYNAPTCIFLSYLLLPPQLGDTGAALYTEIQPGDYPVDIARHKVATGTTYFFLLILIPVFYAAPQTVTSGHACVKSPGDCWCSGIISKTLLINLGTPYTVKSIRITPIPTLESGIGAGVTEIRVGPNGIGDPVFGTIPTVPAPGTTVDVNGSAVGKYIFMKKNSPFSDLQGLCLCFVEVFGH